MSSQATVSTGAAGPGDPTVGSVAATGGASRLTLPVVLCGTFLVTLDFLIVNVTIPALQAGLHANAAAIEAVIAGYGLAYAAGLITGARLGDRYGRRRILAVGLTAFITASAACGLAPTAEWLVAARVVQGAAAALLAPQVLALIADTYTGPARARAFTAYGAVLGVAAVFGQLAGGALIAIGGGWRSGFLVNVPIGLTALMLLRRAVPASERAAGERLDVLGAALVTAGLTAVVGPLLVGRQAGWPPWLWACLAASVPVWAAFAFRQRTLARRGKFPLVAPGLFAAGRFRVGVAAVVALYAGVAAAFLILALYLQDGLKLSALASGAVFAVQGAGFVATSTLTATIHRRLGPRSLPAGGGHPHCRPGPPRRRRRRLSTGVGPAARTGR